ncbi:unnamed protein product [Paramecium pentaurelia]|uniref:OTU domain-containing protein n=1 Tax=Paramecium pentaurelia TaxID=43138 RepID=A0A8S1Y1B7_9CILI|nr:unnamed protein product [Paramecium pentaurelia]
MEFYWWIIIAIAIIIIVILGIIIKQKCVASKLSESNKESNKEQLINKQGEMKIIRDDQKINSLNNNPFNQSLQKQVLENPPYVQVEPPKIQNNRNAGKEQSSQYQNNQPQDDYTKIPSNNPQNVNYKKNENQVIVQQEKQNQQEIYNKLMLSKNQENKQDQKPQYTNIQVNNTKKDIQDNCFQPLNKLSNENVELKNNQDDQLISQKQNIQKEHQYDLLNYNQQRSNQDFEQQKNNKVNGLQINQNNQVKDILIDIPESLIDPPQVIHKSGKNEIDGQTIQLSNIGYSKPESEIENNNVNGQQINQNNQVKDILIDIPESLIDPPQVIHKSGKNEIDGQTIQLSNIGYSKPESEIENNNVNGQQINQNNQVKDILIDIPESLIDPPQVIHKSGKNEIDGQTIQLSNIGYSKPESEIENNNVNGQQINQNNQVKDILIDIPESLIDPPQVIHKSGKNEIDGQTIQLSNIGYSKPESEIENNNVNGQQINQNNQVKDILIDIPESLIDPPQVIHKSGKNEIDGQTIQLSNIGYSKPESEIENNNVNGQQINQNNQVKDILIDIPESLIDPPQVIPTTDNINDGLLLLKNIIDETSNKRQMADELRYYIRRFQDKSDLKKNYGLTFQASSKLYEYCNAFREVRGDGNCFYTAFGYQFLCILLFEYTFDQFQEFIDKIRKSDQPMKIFVTDKDLKIDDKQLEKKLLEEFLSRLTKLKQIDDITQRQEQFNTQFAAYEKQSEEIDGYLYGLSTIFFRNYSNYIVDLSINKDAVYDRENLLKWEEECNSNEVVIAELAKQLNVFVQLIFFKDKDNFVVREYEKDKQHKIILLIKPGHYNIGYFKPENKK